MGDRFSFAQKRDPCKSFFHKFITMFKDGFDPTLEPEKNASNANIGVTVSTDFPGLSPTAKDRSSRNLYAKTDSCTLQALDPDSLEPVGITKQEHLHPDLKGSLSAAHARSDPVTGDIFNFNLEFGSTPTWRIFKVEKASGKTSILATITDCPGAYIHSFFLTGKYVVLCVWNSYFSMNGLSVLYHRNILDALQPYDETKKNRWYVIDRSEKQEGVVGVYESESFYAFHSINAWDEGDDIVCELPVYWSMDILKKFYLHNLLGSSEEALKWFDKGRPIFTRWRLKKVIEGRVLAKCKGKKHSNGMKIRSAVREFTADVMDSMELPTINPNYATKPTRCVSLVSLEVLSCIEVFYNKSLICKC